MRPCLAFLSRCGGLSRWWKGDDDRARPVRQAGAPITGGVPRGQEGPLMIAAGDALQTKHARYVLTPWMPQGNLAPPVIVRGEGIYLYDADGNRYADLTSGLIAVNLGHGHPAARAAMHAQVDRLCFSPPAWFNDARAELAEALVRLAPWGDEGGRVFFTTSGASANEDAIKFARSVTGRAKVLTGYRSFHGSGTGSATLTGENRRWFNAPAQLGGRLCAPREGGDGAAAGRGARARARQARDGRRGARRRRVLRGGVRERPEDTRAAGALARQVARADADAVRGIEEARRVRVRALQRHARRSAADHHRGTDRRGGLGDRRGCRRFGTSDHRLAHVARYGANRIAVLAQRRASAPMPAGSGHCAMRASVSRRQRRAAGRRLRHW